jgi:ribosomal-protein-alanine N-acetyltransferase
MPNWRHGSLESPGKTMPAFFAEPTAVSAHALEVRLEPMTEAHLDAVRALEHSAYAHPWQHRHFADCLASGYQAQMLVADGTVLGYFVAMQGLDEVHLLNITVDPQYQGQGLARVLLDGLALWARGQAAQTLWLEVRVGNARAIHVYEAHGFRRVGHRKAYYPAGDGLREDAIVMSQHLY